MSKITVVGAGIAGLVAAIACAENGADVVVHEAHSTLGGRARATEAPYVAHEGPRAMYADGAAWAWLAERDLIGPAVGPSWREFRAARLRHQGRLRATPPAAMIGMIAHRRRRAPVDVDFFSWAAERHGERAAHAAANLIGVVTYDHDPGRLSAAFVWDLLLRTTAPRPTAVRFVLGGWPRTIERLRLRAVELGVQIATGSRVEALPDPPVIVATQLESAATLLGDPGLSWESGRCVLLDLGLDHDPADTWTTFDLDEAGFAERFSATDPSLAPTGRSLIQATMPLRPDEPRPAATARLEKLIDLGFPGWRDRTDWRRDGTAAGRSGAIDLPGYTWRDRPAIVRGDGVFLAGDMVAAPGMRSEVSINSAVLAAEAALKAQEARTVRHMPSG